MARLETEGVPKGRATWIDGKPTKFIFLLGTLRKKGLNSYLKTLAHLTRLLQKEAFQKALLQASHPREIIEAFKKIEQ